MFYALVCSLREQGVCRLLESQEVPHSIICFRFSC